MKKKPLYKKWYVWFIALVFIGAVGSLGKDENEETVVAEPAVESVSESIAVESSVEPEVMTAADWVDDYEGENIDKILADWSALTDETMKAQLDEQIADSDTTIYGKRVEVTGTAVEFLEGANGFDKSSILIATDGGNTVRIAARTPNDALDIGEKVKATGTIALPLGGSELFVREAVVFIQ